MYTVVKVMISTRDFHPQNYLTPCKLSIWPPRPLSNDESMRYKTTLNGGERGRFVLLLTMSQENDEMTKIVVSILPGL